MSRQSRHTHLYIRLYQIIKNKNGKMLKNNIIGVGSNKTTHSERQVTTATTSISFSE